MILIQQSLHILPCNWSSFPTQQSRSPSTIKFPVRDRKDICRRDSDRLQESTAKRRHESERSAQKRQLPLYQPPFGQIRKHLIHHCLENRCCQIRFTDALIHQRLNISFRIDPAPGGNGIEMYPIFCQRIQRLDIHTEERRHMCQKRSRPTCTFPICSEIHLAISLEIHHPRIFPTQRNSHIDLGVKPPQGLCLCLHFIHERDLQRRRELCRPLPRKSQMQCPLAHFRHQLPPQYSERFPHAIMMRHIRRVHQLPSRRKHDHFDGSGTDINSY